MLQIRDVWQRFVTSGDETGTNGAPPQTFLYAFTTVAVIAAVINTFGVLSLVHDAPEHGLPGPVLREASSWITLVLFFWISWLGYRLAPPTPLRWRLLVHVPLALTYSLCHVAGFVMLRKVAYWAAHSRYDYGPFWPNFSYEFGKDGLAYGLFIVAFLSAAALLRKQHSAVARPLTFDIRDGTKLMRVMLDDILAVSSAGNYVEFSLRDGRKPCMRSSLSTIERELAPHDFIRTHRSWLVNARHVTALTSEGSGDYSVSLGALAVPLSRRFSPALAKLRTK